MQTRVSGPHPLSCVTCRERRKKCDRTRPTCNRCKVGGFTCLGYAPRKTRPIDSIPKRPAQIQSTVPFEPSMEFHFARTDVPDSTLPTTNEAEISLNTYNIDHAWLPMQTIYASPRQLPVHSSVVDSSWNGHVNNVGPSPSAILLEASGYSQASARPTDWPEDSWNNYGHGSDSHSPDDSAPHAHRIHNPATNPDTTQIELTVYLSPDTSPVAAEYITSQYERAYGLMSMELSNLQDSFVKNCILGRITFSRSACWSLFIGAKVFEVAMSDHHTMFIKRYVKPLDKFGQQIAAVNRNGMSVRELAGWLFAVTELFEVKLLIDPLGAYRTLRLAVPIFYSILELEPTIWQGQAGPFLHSILVSPQVGLSRLATEDISISFLTGLPQLIPWDPSFLPRLAHLSWDEWMPACPVVFLLALSGVNSWRHRDSRTRDRDEWRLVERQVREWRPDYRAQNPGPSWKVIGRLAAQEALRHMVLIYLYMGMGGRTSGDPQVQASCKQIVQLCTLVEANPNMSVSLHFPAVTAGVCVIGEKHRSIIYKCLEQAEKCRSYLFGAVEFTGAIQHLWHGAGRNGAEVTWDDYINSFRAVVKMKR